MSNKRIMMFVIALVVLIIGISAVSATDVSSNDTTTVTTTDSSDAATATATQSIAEDTSNVQTTDAVTTSTTKKVTKDKTTTKTKATTKEKSNGKNLKTEGFPETYIVTNTTFNQFFTNGSLNERVNEGDTLDFQGAFHTTSTTNYTMVIDKPVNLISSTQNSNISLNTTSTDFFGKNPGDAFVITNGGSGTNVTGLYFYNTQIFVRNAHNVTLKNLTVIDEYQVVGGGVGVLSVRENSSYVTVRDSYFRTENNGGHSTLVGAWVNHCIFDNNTIVGVGNIGNLIYLTSYNVDIVGNSTNDNNIISNNKIQGPQQSISICYGIAFCGCNNLVENNTVNYSRGGMGITIQWGSGTSVEGDAARRTVNNTYRNNVVNNCSSNIPTNSTVVNNTFSEDVTLNSQVEAYNNTFDGVTLNGIVNIHNNNINNLTVSDVSNQRTDYTIANNTINNIIFTAASGRSSTTENITIIDNVIKNNITVTGSSGSVNNINLTKNNITGTVQLGKLRNQKIENSTITDNNITTSNTYTIELTQKATNITITNNYLRSNNYVSDSTVLDNGVGNNIYSNLPLRTNTTIDVNPVNDVLYDSNVEITGTLKDINGNAMSGATIGVVSKSVTAITNNNGEFTLTVLADHGTNNISVVYMGDNTYSNSRKNVIFNGLKHNTSLTANITESNQIVGKLTDVNNTEIPYATIVISIGNGTYETYTDDNGDYSFDIPASVSNANTALVIFEEDIDYNPTNVSVQFTPSKTVTNITVNVTTSGQNVNIIGVLNDINGNKINNATVTIQINNNTYTRVTNENGTYSLNISSLSINTYNVAVIYNGNSKYMESNASAVFNITKVGTVITTNNMTGYLGSHVILNATIKDINGNPITNGTVLIKLNGKSTGNANITRDGKIAYNLYLDPNNYGKEGYNVTFVYGGSNTTESIRTNTRLNVIPFNPVINLTTTPSDLGDNVTMTVTITNGRGYNALSGNIGFKINGLTYKINKQAVKVQVTNGKVVLSFYASKKFIGNNNITILYSGNGKFNQIKQEFTNIVHINSYRKSVIHVSNITTKIGQNVRISARFTDVNGNPLTKGAVAIKINGKTFGHANITNGVASYTQYIDPNKFSAKDYIITFKFAGKGQYAPATINATLSLSKYTPTFTYNTTTVKKGTNAKITVKLTDNTKKVNVQSGTVGLKINGKTYKVNKQPVTVTPVNGTATFNVPTGNLQANNNITFTYGGNRLFNGGKYDVTNGLIIRN